MPGGHRVELKAAARSADVIADPVVIGEAVPGHHLVQLRRRDEREVLRRAVLEVDVQVPLALVRGVIPGGAEQVREPAERRIQPLLKPRPDVVDHLGLRHVQTRHASTEAIAARAEVGVGTVFRHFRRRSSSSRPSSNECSKSSSTRRARVSRTTIPAARSSRSSLASSTELARRRRSWRASPVPVSTCGAARGRARCATRWPALLQRAQKAKAVRRDVTITELMAIVVAASRAVEHLGKDRAARQRTVSIIFDGLRPR